jgi:uncharacterized protein (DUF1330 family)
VCLTNQGLASTQPRFPTWSNGTVAATSRGPAQVIEGEHRPGMLVLLEFPSLEQIQAMYDSEEYAPLKALRQRSSAMNFLAVEGL